MDKRLICLFTAAFGAMLFGTFPVSGQTPESPAAPAASAVPATPAAPAVPVDSVSQPGLVGEPIPADSLERIDSVDTDLVALRRSAEGEEVVLEVAGFGITLSSLSDEKIQIGRAHV